MRNDLDPEVSEIETDDGEMVVGRRILVAVTLAILLMQAIRLTARFILVGPAPTMGMWGQAGLAVWICMELWEGKEWARVLAGIYFFLAVFVGMAILVLMKMTPALQTVSAVQVLLAAAIAITLAKSASLQLYMARRASAKTAG